MNPKEERFLKGIQIELLDFFELNDYRSYSLNQIHKAFAIRDRKTKEIYGDALTNLAKEGRLIR
ncbi:MAG: Ribonuclease, partial [Bacteroidota bacterium]